MPGLRLQVFRLGRAAALAGALCGALASGAVAQQPGSGGGWADEVKRSLDQPGRPGGAQPREEGGGQGREQPKGQADERRQESPPGKPQA